MQTFIGRIRGALARRGTRRKDDPLLRPLGRTTDEAVDAALALRSMSRAELFTLGSTLAPHRGRLAAMIEMHGLTAASLVSERWPELKQADRRCALCENTARCTRWLLWGRRNDAPRMFCPNAASLEGIMQLGGQSISPESHSGSRQDAQEANTVD